MKICIVIANYYPNISNNLLGSAVNLLKIKGYKNLSKIFVPGIFEIPFVISKNIKKYNAFIALGCVIKGKTPHFDFISHATTNAIMQLSITSKKPIGNGIITCLNKKQAYERSTGKRNKGVEATKAILAVMSAIKNEKK